MSVGRNKDGRISKRTIWEDYYENLHSAYNAMREAFKKRSAKSGLTQDDIAAALNIDKALISRRLRGSENLTLKSLSAMATAMDCRIRTEFIPYDEVGLTNYYIPTTSQTGVVHQSGPYWTKTNTSRVVERS